MIELGIDFIAQDVPDAATLLHFRRLLERKELGNLFLARSTVVWKARAE